MEDASKKTAANVILRLVTTAADKVVRALPPEGTEVLQQSVLVAQLAQFRERTNNPHLEALVRGAAVALGTCTKALALPHCDFCVSE